MAVRRLTTIGCVAVLGGVLGIGPATAAPLDFAPGQKLEADCSDPLKAVTLTPLPGNGAFTPYQVSNGQLLVPTEFRVTSGATDLLKTRHLVPDPDGELVASKGTAGMTKCVFSSSIQGVAFSATIYGNLVGRAKR
jgi:hypothetical protein